METMDSEVEIEVEIEVDLTGREDKVNVEVGVTFKLNLCLYYATYFWQGILYMSTFGGGS